MVNKGSLKNLELKIRILYPIWIAVAIFSVAYVPSVIFIEGDILTTSKNVIQHEILFRFGIIGTCVTAVLMVYISFYLYLLFEHINRNRARLMLILALISIPFIGFEIFKFVSIGMDNAEFVYNNLNVSQNAMTLASIFWGLWLFPLGKLVIESGYFPKTLGYLLMASCIGYLMSVCIKILFPGQNYVLLFSEILTFGEVVFALWFVFKGIQTE